MDELHKTVLGVLIDKKLVEIELRRRAGEP